jgi:hypothetical protein
MYKKREVTEEELKVLKAQVKRLVHRDIVVCDFCGHDQPRYIYAAKRMSTGYETECWRWTACEKCDEAIDRKDWVRLKERIIEGMLTLRLFGFSLPQITVAVEAAFQGFLEDALTVKPEEGGQQSEWED